MGIKLLHKKLQLLNPQLPRLILESLNEVEADVIRLNQAQLREGKRSDGKILGRYRESTKKAKRNNPNRKLTGDLISLLDYGDFWQGFFFKAENGKLVFGSEDDKTDLLIKQWGETIFGLGKDSYAELTRIVSPVLVKKIKDFINT